MREKDREGKERNVNLLSPLSTNKNPSSEGLNKVQRKNEKRTKWLGKNLNTKRKRRRCCERANEQRLINQNRGI